MKQTKLSSTKFKAAVRQLVVKMQVPQTISKPNMLSIFRLEGSNKCNMFVNLTPTPRGREYFGKYIRQRKRKGVIKTCIVAPYKNRQHIKDKRRLKIYIRKPTSTPSDCIKKLSIQ